MVKAIGRPQEAETARAFFQGTNLRVGATVPTAKVLERPGTRTFSLHHQADADASENLVPKSQVISHSVD